MGLPPAVQKRLREAALAKGWQIDFARLRVHYSFRELAVDGFHLRRTNTLAGPEIYVSEAYCRFRPGALRRLEFDVEALRLADGFVFLPVSGNSSTAGMPALPVASTNELASANDQGRTGNGRPPEGGTPNGKGNAGEAGEAEPGNGGRPSNRRITFRHVSGELLVKSDDQWELRNFQASFLGANLQLMGVLTNSSLLRDWKFKKAPSDAKRSGKAFWSNVLRAIEPIKFTGTPQLIGQFYGDAADPVGMEASVRFAAPAVSTPWGAGRDVRMLARLSPPTEENDIVLMDLAISTQDANSPWGQAEHVEIHAQMEPSYPRLSTTNALFTIDARGVRTRWTSMESANVKVRLTGLGHAEATSGTQAGSSKNAVLLQTDIALRAKELETLGWRGETVELTAKAIHPDPKQLRLSDTNLLWLDRMSNITMNATGTVAHLRSGSVRVDRTSWQLRWDSPAVHLDTTSAISGSDLNLALQCRADSREARFQGSSSVDPRSLMPLLPAKTQRWLSRYSWSKAPLVVAEGQLRLPEWGSGKAPKKPLAVPAEGGTPDAKLAPPAEMKEWVSTVLPTITLSGQFKIGSAAYRGVDVLGATSHFGLTNFVWTMPDLLVTRPEGVIQARYESDLSKSDFHWKLRGPVDVKIAEPWLETEQQRRIFTELKVTQPPWLEAELWGTWRDFNRFGAAGSLSASNAAFRGQAVGLLQTRFHYTNQILTLLEPKVKRPREEGSAPGIQIDIGRLKLFITNAFGNLDPHAVVRTIGRQATRAIEPFTFEVPPTTRVSGVIDLKKKSYEDELHFEVAGGRFRWNKFDLQQLSGKVDWVGRTVNFSELDGILMTGRATGEARFDFAPKEGADFSFKVVAAETDLAEVLSGFGRTNKVEGVLSGELVVTSANTSSNFNSWHGHGRVHVRDGLLWDLPMFGLFSPVLNAFAPGLGNSRAREASATFAISNSVVHSKDLEVHATGMRMNFEGMAAFDGRVDARVGAELLRDFPGIGLLLSKVLWPVTKVFEYKVSGTLSHPKSEPIYVIPKLLLIPLQPVKTIRDIITEQPAGSR